MEFPDHSDVERIPAAVASWRSVCATVCRDPDGPIAWRCTQAPEPRISTRTLTDTLADPVYPHLRSGLKTKSYGRKCPSERTAVATDVVQALLGGVTASPLSRDKQGCSIG